MKTVWKSSDRSGTGSFAANPVHAGESLHFTAQVPDFIVFHCNFFTRALSRPTESSRGFHANRKLTLACQSSRRTFTKPALYRGIFICTAKPGIFLADFPHAVLSTFHSSIILHFRRKYLISSFFSFRLFRDQSSRSERLLWGNIFLAGLGVQFRGSSSCSQSRHAARSTFTKPLLYRGFFALYR